MCIRDSCWNVREYIIAQQHLFNVQQCIIVSKDFGNGRERQPSQVDRPRGSDISIVIVNKSIRRLQDEVERLHPSVQDAWEEGEPGRDVVDRGMHACRVMENGGDDEDTERKSCARCLLGCSNREVTEEQ